MKWTAIVAAFALAACEDKATDGTSTDPLLTSPPVIWVTLADGSRTRFHSGSSTSTAERCQPSPIGFDCLRIIQIFSEIKVIRFERRELSNSYPLYGGGYSCEIYPEQGLAIEQIGTRGAAWPKDLPSEKLVENTAGHGVYGDRTFWAQSYVDAFIKENQLPYDNLYFRCEAVWELLTSGSLRSLGTTAFDPRQAMPPIRGAVVLNEDGDYLSEGA